MRRWSVRIRQRAPNITMIELRNYDCLTSDDLLKTNKDYITISTMLTDMAKSGIITMGAGYCVSMADMVITALKHCKIECKTVECHASFTYHNENPPAHRFIGYDKVVNPGEIDTHVVVLALTNPPMLIDASISHRLPQGLVAIIEPVKSIPGSDVLIDSHFSNYNISTTYVEKKLQHIPKHHQESILERVETDRKIFRSLTVLKAIVVVALAISTLNAIRGLYDFYQVYHVENNWGPRSMKMLDERLDAIEEHLKLIKDPNKK